MNKIKRLSIILAAGLAVTGLMSGCSPAASPNTSQVITSDSLIPISVELSNLDGSTINAVMGSVIYISTGNVQNKDLVADIDDTSVATFVKGKADASVTTAPSIKILKTGSTKVSLTYPEGKVTFQIIVKDSSDVKDDSLDEPDKTKEGHAIPPLPKPTGLPDK